MSCQKMSVRLCAQKGSFFYFTKQSPLFTQVVFFFCIK
uniref:Uncharacterized protein n=1 Tax=Anguilla anguilla TaxID=7936 RepID=A0A0E9RKB4_ANGAN